MNGAAIVLCGGRSRRMGRPKWSLTFGPETLLERVVRLAGSVADEVVVVAAPLEEQSLNELPGDVTIVRDPTSGLGPLQGIVTGLAALPDAVELAYVTAVDSPFLNPRWIEYLATRIGADDVAIPFVDGRHHPLAAIYRRRSVLPIAQALIQAGRLRPVFLMESLRCRIILEGEMRGVDPGLETLRNLNTPEEYRMALEDAGLA